MKIYALKFRAQDLRSHPQQISNYPVDQVWKFEAAFMSEEGAKAFANAEFGRIDWTFDGGGSGSWRGISARYSRDFLVEIIQVQP